MARFRFRVSATEKGLFQIQIALLSQGEAC